MSRTIVKTLKVDGITNLMRRVVPGLETEWELVEGYTSSLLSNMLDKFIDKYTIEAYPNFDFLFHFLIILKAVLFRQAPIRFNESIYRIDVIKRYRKNNSWYIDVEYVML